MFDKLCDNLNILMAKARVNASELARQTGLPASTIKKIRNNDNPNPTLTTLIPLAQYFSITLSQLIGEETVSEFYLQKLELKSSNIIQRIPLIDWKEANAWPENRIGYNKYTALDKKYNENIFALCVNENNWDKFPKSTILIIDPTSTIEHEDYVVISQEKQEIPTVNQIIYDNGKFLLKPIISGQCIKIFTSQHKFLGVVIEHRHLLKSSE